MVGVFYRGGELRRLAATILIGFALWLVIQADNYETAAAGVQSDDWSIVEQDARELGREGRNGVQLFAGSHE